MNKYLYIPGDDWLYYKIYCGAKTADEILTTVIKPMVDDDEIKKLFDKWFFIRYADPDFHLRVRFKLYDIKNIGLLMEYFNNAIEPFVKNNLVWKINIDSYLPEYERYNYNAILLAEDLFCSDSEWTINFIDLIEGDEGEKIRWMTSFLSIDKLLSDFEYSISQKLELLQMIKTGFANEFGMNKSLKVQLDKKFREHRKDIGFIMNLTLESAGELLPILNYLETRSLKNKQVLSKLKKLESDNESVNIRDLLPSYIHMLMNRFFRSKQRVHELVAYDLLFKYYKSEMARQKYSSKNSETKVNS